MKLSKGIGSKRVEDTPDVKERGQLQHDMRRKHVESKDAAAQFHINREVGALWKSAEGCPLGSANCYGHTLCTETTYYSVGSERTS